MTEAPKTGAPADGRRTPSPDEILAAVSTGTSGHEVRVGAFILFGIISAVVVLFLLTDPATFRGRYLVRTTMENAGGIRRGDPVQMRGVNIGRIHGFRMRNDERVDISLEIEGEWKIPDDSRTHLGLSGVFGGRTMEIVVGRSPTYYKAGDHIPGEGSSSDMFASLENVGNRAGAALQRIEALLNTGTVEAVQGSATELEALLFELSTVTKEQRGALRRLTSSLARSAQELEDASAAESAGRALARADSAMATLTRTSESLDAAMTSIRSLLDRIDRGEGTLGKLATDDALYDNLNRAAENVASLVADLQANPGKYINVSIF